MPSRTPALQRLRSIRASLLLLALVPSLTLGGLWATTSARVLSEGFGLRAEFAINMAVAKPFGDMIDAAARERTLSTVWLADPNASHDAMKAQRRKTDVAVAEMAGLPAALKDAPETSKEAFQPVLDAMRKLDLTDLRARIDNRSTDARTASAAFTRVINAEIVGTAHAFRVTEASLMIAGIPVANLIDAREQLQLGDATLAPAVASGQMSSQDRATFAYAVGARRHLLANLPRDLDARHLAEVKKLTSGKAWKTMEKIEDAVISHRNGDSTGLPAVARQWPGTLAEILPQMQKVTVDPILALVARSQERADSLLWQGLLTSGAGLVAVIVVTLLSWRVTRSLMRRLAGLRRATLELADTRLPSLIDRLNRGENVDVESEAADLAYGDDELGKVAQAFNSAQRTALRSAVSLADARRGFQKAILGVARHTQNLVNRQLSLLDTMEREHQDPDVLKGLYELDSQASQMRRYEENLVIISGGQPGRRWTEPVTVIDVIRSAVGEVADYQRITVHADERLKLSAHAVADVIHLLAELMENATSYSHPVCPVWVRTEYVSKGLAVEIEDRGLGMSEEEYAEANQRLAQPPPFDVLALADDTRLGLFVIARLATQHGIRVTLRSSPFGGASAVILIPSELLIEDSPEAPDPAATPVANTQPVAAIVGTTAQAGAHTALHHDEQSASERPSVFTPMRRPATTPASSTFLADGPTATTPPGTSVPFHGAPLLPQRVPQASLAEELRRDPPPANALPSGPDPLPQAEQVARTMSAFQRGTVHARDFGAHALTDHNSSAPTKAPR
ncbi:nitrate- and nitrite sensing domain-containing protein [Streptomyces sp. NBC_01314]|uniref:sensor histidine kinase n=1 Tax=Streptomyces sp. NBC_01314 TaxID=2903821 RepID=UPI00308C2A1F|nr:nitrate- and nitrite sensing domain-containing protein [Streptomyces sp. NBC_01314]